LIKEYLPLMEEQVLKRFDEMLALGTKVLGTRRAPAPGHLTSDFVDIQLANQWFTSSLSLIARTLGEDSEQYRAMKRQFTEHPKFPHAQQSFGVLESARDDIQSGALFEIKALITAEVFDDFLEQAQALLSAKYFAPAAVVIGAVLEDGRTALCSNIFASALAF